MIRIEPITFKYTDGFTVTGHANYAEHGADIVCSAISAIVQTTEMALHRHSNIYSTFGIESIIEEGHISVHIKESNVYTNILVDAMINGIRAIIAKYPQYVTIQEEEYDKRF